MEVFFRAQEKGGAVWHVAELFSDCVFGLLNRSGETLTVDAVRIDVKDKDGIPIQRVILRPAAITAFPMERVVILADQLREMMSGKYSIAYTGVVGERDLVF